MVEVEIQVVQELADGKPAGQVRERLNFGIDHGIKLDCEERVLDR